MKIFCFILFVQDPHCFAFFFDLIGRGSVAVTRYCYRKTWVILHMLVVFTLTHAVNCELVVTEQAPQKLERENTSGKKM